MNDRLKHDLRHWLTALLGALETDDVPLARQVAAQMTGLLDGPRVATISLNDAVRDIAPLLGEVRLVLAEPDVFVRTDPASLGRVLMNLAVNARQAGEAATLRVGRDGDYASIAVEDTGPGMPPDVLARIFEPGFTTRERSGGSGLGLAIVRELIQAGGGTVTAESADGRGTIVTVRWPSTPPPVVARNRP